MNQTSLRIKVVSWISAGRFVFTPWILLNSLFGALIGSFRPIDWFVSFIIALSMLTTGHFINDWRDFVNGLDKLDEGSKKKPYTNAQQILPQGLLSLETIKASALFFGALSAVLLFWWFDFSADYYLFYFIGMFLSLTYTDLAKPKGIGELYMFLGHGFSTVCFTYSIMNGLDLVGILGGCLLGFWSAMAYTVDQWKDIEVDHKNGIRTLANRISRRGLQAWDWWLLTIVGSFILQAVLIIYGVLSIETIITVLGTPIAWFVHSKLKEDFDKGLLLVLIYMWINTSLLILGQLPL